MEYPEIATQIIALKKADLELRDKLIASGQLGEGYHDAMAHLHNEHARILGEIIDAIGYPTIHQVGKEASEAAWLVIQHTIGQPAFMKRCARLLAQAVQEKQADPKHLAYLTDRIAVLEGNPQRYGTQFDWDSSGELSPHFFDELDLVNERRKALGLSSLEEQTAVIRAQAKNEKQSPPADLDKRNKEMEQWKKAVGWQ